MRKCAVTMSTPDQDSKYGLGDRCSDGRFHIWPRLAWSWPQSLAGVLSCLIAVASGCTGPIVPDVRKSVPMVSNLFDCSVGLYTPPASRGYTKYKQGFSFHIGPALKEASLQTLQKELHRLHQSRLVVVHQINFHENPHRLFCKCV